MRILLTGARGQLGRTLEAALSGLHDVTALDRGACDLSDAAQVRAVVRGVAPEVIVNAAAYTAVDKAEQEAALAFAVNATGPGVIGEEACKLGALVVHYSTDYVFDGRKAGFYREDDATGPLNVYGRSKLAGEQALAQSGARHAVLRTSGVVSPHGSNFIGTILKLVQQRDRLSVVADQHGVPTAAALLADVTVSLIRHASSAPDPWPSGIYHAVPSGETTWHALAQLISAQAVAAGFDVKATPDRIMPIAAADYPAAALRPLNSRLETAKLGGTFGIRLAPWEDGVQETLTAMLADPARRI